MKSYIYFLAFLAILFYLVYTVVSYGLNQVYEDQRLEQQKYEHYMHSQGH